MNLTLKMEKAKTDYVNAINEVTKKYDLDICLVEILIGAIYNETLRLKQVALQDAIKEEKESDNNEQTNYISK